MIGAVMYFAVEQSIVQIVGATVACAVLMALFGASFWLKDWLQKKRRDRLRG